MLRYYGLLISIIEHEQSQPFGRPIEDVASPIIHSYHKGGRVWLKALEYVVIGSYICATATNSKRIALTKITIAAAIMVGFGRNDSVSAGR